MRTVVVIAVLAALFAASSTVGVSTAQASNPVVALRLVREAVRVSNQIVALTDEGQNSNSIEEMCGYYVPTISAKTRRLRQIVRQLYVYAPRSMRWRVDKVARTVRQLGSMTGTMRDLCATAGY